MTTVIAVASNKGGVAKTTTTLSLGGSLAAENRLALLVDLDPQAHLTASLGIKPEGLRRTVGDALLAQNSLVAVSQETAVSNLDLAPANRELVILDKVLYKRPRYEHRLRESLERMGDQLYDVVVIDCPPNFGTLTLNAMTAADLLIIPIQCEYYAIRSLRQTLELVQLVRKKTNPRLRYRLLVTMFDMRNRIHCLLLKQMRERFPTALFETIIQVDTRLRESPAFGLPIIQHTPNTRAARQYRKLAAEVMPTARNGEDARTESRPMGTLTPHRTIPSLSASGA
jgi:chromosome partitioning protein